MVRSLFAVAPVLALLVGALVAEDRKDKTDDPLPKPKKKVAHPHARDVEEFLKEHDKDKDGYLTREELPERFRHAFDRLDVNKDGKLSRDEFLRGWAHLQARRRTADVVHLLVEMSDSDPASLEELQHLYDTLRKLDKNKDGKIDAGELKAARTRIVKERVDNLFKELDANKDGKISREEARGWVKRHFDELDANKDGFVDRAELLKAASERPVRRTEKKGPREKREPK